MSEKNISFGKTAETFAAGFLENNGYRILTRNYKNKFGEIDIIARQAQTVCFIEVKARLSQRAGAPTEAVTRAKQKQISKVALGFLQEKNWLDKKARFDVVAVNYEAETPLPTLIKDAFELDSSYFY